MELPSERSEGVVASMRSVLAMEVDDDDGVINVEREAAPVAAGIVNVPSDSWPVTAIFTGAPGVKPLPVVCTEPEDDASGGDCKVICTLRFVPVCGPPASGGMLSIDGTMSTYVTTGAAV